MHFYWEQEITSFDSTKFFKAISVLLDSRTQDTVCTKTHTWYMFIYVNQRGKNCIIIMFLLLKQWYIFKRLESVVFGYTQCSLRMLLNKQITNVPRKIWNNFTRAKRNKLASGDWRLIKYSNLIPFCRLILFFFSFLYFLAVCVWVWLLIIRHGIIKTLN